MGHRKTQIIATVYGKPSEQQMLDELAEHYNTTKTRLLKDMIKKEHKRTLGSDEPH